MTRDDALTLKKQAKKSACCLIRGVSCAIFPRALQILSATAPFN
jgi:hypothetical protein